MIGTIATVAACTTAASAGAYFAPQVARGIQHSVLADYTRATRSLVFSYDDGPGVSLTSTLLDLLRACKVHATFFALGSNAQANPLVMDRIVAEGHELGSHTQSHLHAWKTSPLRAARDVREGFASLARWMPSGGGPFRPPFGKLTLPTWLAARRAGASKTCWWTIDSGDTRSVLPNVQTVIDQVSRAGGGVLLMHDFERVQPARAAFVLALTESLVALADREALVIHRLGDLFAAARRGTSPCDCRYQ